MHLEKKNKNTILKNKSLQPTRRKVELKEEKEGRMRKSGPRLRFGKDPRSFLKGSEVGS